MRARNSPSARGSRGGGPGPAGTSRVLPRGEISFVGRDSITARAGSAGRNPHLREHTLPKRLDECLLVSSDLMQLQLLEAEFDVLRQPSCMLVDIGRNQQGLAHVLWIDEARGGVEVLW